MEPVRGARAAPRRDGRLSEPREPLWARGLVDQPPPAEPDFFAEPASASDPAAPAPPVSASGLVMVVMAVITAALAVGIVTGRTAHLRRTVPSAWGDIPMACDTTRYDTADGALELFECQAVAGALPPGVYRSPRDNWSSDLTGRPALASAIRVTRDGALTGVAIY